MKDLGEKTYIKLWDKLWLKALVGCCDLTIVTKVTRKVHKQDAETGCVRMGQWCSAVLKCCNYETVGGLIMIVCDGCSAITSEEEAMKVIGADDSTEDGA